MGWLNNPARLKRRAEKAARDAAIAEKKAGKTFRRTGHQLKKAERLEQRATVLGGAATSKSSSVAWGRCVKNNHLVARKHGVCPIDGSEIK